MRARDEPPTLDIHLGDNLPILGDMTAASFELIYVDPPFNTGKDQVHTRLRTVRDEAGGDRVGFEGRRYRSVSVDQCSWHGDDSEDLMRI